ncbi:MAG: Ku protein [Ilumatobacteraceae bacterium]
MAAIKKDVNVQIGPFLKAKVSVHAAVDDDDKEVSLKTVCCGDGLKDETGPAKDVPHTHAPTAIKQLLRCPTCLNDDKATFKKAKQDGNVFAVVDTEALAAVQAESAGDSTLMDFTVHDVEDFDGRVLNGDKVYFLESVKSDEKTYALIRSVVEANPDKVILTTWAARSKPAMYRLTTFNGALAVQKIAWLDSIREAPAVDFEPSEKEIGMAGQLLSMAVMPFDAATYKDTRNEALAHLIAQAQGVEGIAAPATVGSAPKPTGGSLEDMLAAALAAAGATVEDAPAPKKRAPRKAKASA